MVDDVLAETKDGMEKAVEALQHDLASMRTGRASTGLVEKLLVDYYGTPTQLQELALLSVPEPQLISIRPYDPGAMKEIERAIMQSDLGLTPNNDGKIIRLQIPSLTEERRRNLTKAVSKRSEEARVSVRNTRRKSLEDLKSFEKEKLISEDDMYVGRDKIQKMTDDYIKRIDEVGAAKEKEILEV
ncbi:MAG TPA: ribosome recycling factor [Anaerolineae bacterium]|nr:ribosome recycling factor [Anaerolineae bacterium]HMR62547.1 ribosome recycling factor [Anaerolineae bacterium]